MEFEIIEDINPGSWHEEREDSRVATSPLRPEWLQWPQKALLIPESEEV